MAESSVQSAVQWLGLLLVEETEKVQGIQPKLEQLRDELDWLQCFLREADAVRHSDPRIRRWVNQIQDIAYEAEDIVENFLNKLNTHPKQQHTRKAYAIKNRIERYVRGVKEVKAIHDAANSDIEALRVKISTLTSRLQAYGIKITRAESGSFTSRVLGTEMNASKKERIIGLDDQVKEIVANLVRETAENRIIGIWGEGGVGKTTLARKVYHDQAIRKHFDRFGWVYVPQNCKISDLLKGLLSSLTTKSWDEIALLTDQELTRELYEVQEEKKCLVVLDDVWNSDIWYGLKTAFPGDEDKYSASKILFTTHSKQVAEQMDESAVIREMKCLSYDESCELLQTKLGGISTHIFGYDGANKMKEMAKTLLKSCQEIPLAIIALGGLLATMKTPQEWQNLLDHIKSHQLGKVHQRPYEKVLELCYYHLPYYLKNCYLHLGNFAEDFEISAKRLCHMWVAEGIVTLPNGEVSREELLEDFAEHCLGELVERGMVQVTKTGTNGKIKSCCLHDLMRDLCLKACAQEHFLSVIDSDSNLVKGKARRLAIYLGGEYEEFSLLAKNSLLRSLILFSSQKERPEVNYTSVKVLCRDSQLLRVMDLEGIVISSKILPREIGDLMYLRYLSLKDMLLTKLPISIGSLRWLETLDLRVKLSLEIPNVLSRLEKLRNLYLHHNFTVSNSEKLRLDNLKYLLTLKNADHFLIQDVLQMENLRKASVKYLPDNGHVEFIKRSPRAVFSLTIFRVSISEDQVNVLQSFNNLIKLELKGGVSVPINKLTFLPNLKKILFDFCGFKQDPMPVLEKLPRLTSLCLDQQAYIGNRMICTATGFPQLNYLRLNGLKNLQEWVVEQGAMPNLHNCWFITVTTHIKWQS